VECEYWAKCSPLAPFVVNDCVQALSQLPQSWNYVLGEFASSFPSVALFQAIDAGSIRYDPVQANACLQALREQSCHGFELWGAAPCDGMFSCATGGQVEDAGPSCLAGLGFPFGNDWPTCSTAGDCSDAAVGPYCFDGHCVSAPCGNYVYGATQCSAVVGVGEPCDSDPPFLGGQVLAGTAPCAAGLTCRGFASEDGGLGVCAKPEDVRGSCVANAAITGCATGLVCPQCGQCAFPPNSGACSSGQASSPISFEFALGRCQYGVSYCDQPQTGGTCHPVIQAGGNCNPNYAVCASTLVCSETMSTCGTTLQ
jgi:hypothetical protein